MSLICLVLNFQNLLPQYSLTDGSSANRTASWQLLLHSLSLHVHSRLSEQHTFSMNNKVATASSPPASSQKRTAVLFQKSVAGRLGLAYCSEYMPFDEYVWRTETLSRFSMASKLDALTFPVEFFLWSLPCCSPGARHRTFFGVLVEQSL